MSRFACLLLVLVHGIQLATLEPITYIFPEFSSGSVSVISPTTSTASIQSSTLAQFARKSSDTTIIQFVGDVLLGRNVEFLMLKHGREYPFLGSSFLKQDNSYVVGNFESAVPPVHVPTLTGQLTFSVAETYLSLLKEAGFTHFSVANNHSLDYGTSGLEHTRVKLMDNDLTPLGDPEEVSVHSVTYVDCGRDVVALVGINALEPVVFGDVTRLMNQASKRSNFQIIYVHWGTEYQLLADKQQRDLAEFLIEAGADLIIGHHPHVVQDIDIIDGVLVFYSLGNFLFDQYFSKETMRGLAVTLDLSKGIAYIYPVTSELNLSQPHVMNMSERDIFLLNLAEKSNPELKEQIMHGVLPLRSLVATSPKIAMIGR